MVWCSSNEFDSNVLRRRARLARLRPGSHGGKITTSCAMPQWPGGDVLLIGVPVANDKNVVAVIEVVQRSGSRPSAQQGYLRFVREMAHIVAGCPSLGT